LSVADYREDMRGCVRCSSCKWVPFNHMKSHRFSRNCPSISRFNFHSFSGSGRMNMGLSVLEGRSELTEKVSEVLYSCQMCGACDTACKSYREIIDITEVLLELRAECVESGQFMVEHMMTLDALKRENNMLGEPKAERGAWAAGLDLKDINKEKVDVMLHVGCRFSYDPELRGSVRRAVRLLQEAGLDIGTAGAEESCCGGRAFELGYQGEARNFADDLAARVKASGARYLLTPCSDGFAAFNYLYPLMGIELGAEPVHMVQLLDVLISEGKLKLANPIGMRVTYHDPCHLGRMSEPFLGAWKGDKRDRLRSQSRTGRFGVYEEPRRVLCAVPGLELVEMERIKEYSWCCGAGGGVYDAFPEFAIWTARERLEEAASTGASAIVTACPWCERVFMDAVGENGFELKILDVVDVVARAAGLEEEE